GIDPDALAAPLSYLYHHHLAPPALRARALPERYVDMRRLDAGAVDPVRIPATLPPLIKGYVRLGAKTYGPPALDADFGVADFFVVLDLHAVDERYLKFFLGVQV
ncbi:MAG TPA: hypothetical protein VJX66_27025, partial [Amycolatopsis sp.]|nr:hypothetical protein [Amycolatopsis sp.]